VIEGIRKAMELNAEKDKTQLLGLLDQTKTESIVLRWISLAFAEQS